MANRSKAKNNQEKIRTHLSDEIPVLAVYRKPGQQGFREDFRETAFPRFSQALPILPFPESPIHCDRRAFLPRNVTCRRLRSRNHPGGRRKFAVRRCRLNCQRGTHFRSFPVRILLSLWQRHVELSQWRSPGSFPRILPGFLPGHPGTHLEFVPSVRLSGTRGGSTELSAIAVAADRQFASP